MQPVVARLSEAYLKELAGRKDTYVHCKCINRHIIIEPSGLSDIKAAVRKNLDAIVNKYDQTLGGIFLGYSNLKLIQSKGLISYDDSFVHLDISADFYVFSPKEGSVLTGVVTKAIKNHVGCLVHKVFNVSVTNDTEQEDWFGDTVQVGQEVQFEVTVLKMSGPLPYIRGKFSEVFSSGQHQNRQVLQEEGTIKKKKETGTKKKAKEKLKLQVNIDDCSSVPKKKKKKLKRELTELTVGELPVFEDLHRELPDRTSSSPKKKRKKFEANTDDFDLNQEHIKKKQKVDKLASPGELKLPGKVQHGFVHAGSENIMETLRQDEVRSSTEVVGNYCMTNPIKKHKKKAAPSSLLQDSTNVKNLSQFSSDTSNFLSPSKKKAKKRNEINDKNFLQLTSDTNSAISHSKEKQNSGVKHTIELISPLKKIKKRKKDQQDSGISTYAEDNESDIESKSLKKDKIVRESENPECNYAVIDNECKADITSAVSPTRKKKKSKTKTLEFESLHPEEILNTKSEYNLTKTTKVGKLRQDNRLSMYVEDNEFDVESESLKKDRIVSVSENPESNYEVIANECKSDISSAVSPTRKKKKSKKKALEFESLHPEEILNTKSEYNLTKTTKVGKLRQDNRLSMYVEDNEFDVESESLKKDRIVSVSENPESNYEVIANECKSDISSAVSPTRKKKKSKEKALEFESLHPEEILNTNSEYNLTKTAKMGKLRQDNRLSMYVEDNEFDVESESLKKDRIVSVSENPESNYEVIANECKSDISSAVSPTRKKNKSKKKALDFESLHPEIINTNSEYNLTKTAKVGKLRQDNMLSLYAEDNDSDIESELLKIDKIVRASENPESSHEVMANECKADITSSLSPTKKKNSKKKELKVDTFKCESLSSEEILSIISEDNHESDLLKKDKTSKEAENAEPIDTIMESIDAVIAKVCRADITSQSPIKEKKKKKEQELETFSSVYIPSEDNHESDLLKKDKTSKEAENSETIDTIMESIDAVIAKVCRADNTSPQSPIKKKKEQELETFSSVYIPSEDNHESDLLKKDRTSKEAENSETIDTIMESIDAVIAKVCRADNTSPQSPIKKKKEQELETFSSVYIPSEDNHESDLLKKDRTSKEAENSETIDTIMESIDAVIAKVCRADITSPQSPIKEKKKKKEQELETFPSKYIPSEEILSTESEYSYTKTAEMNKKKKKQEIVGNEPNLQLFPESLQNKSGDNVSHPPSSKVDKTPQCSHTSILNSLLDHARSLLKESAIFPFNTNIMDKKQKVVANRAKKNTNKKETDTKEDMSTALKSERAKFTRIFPSDVLHSGHNINEGNLNVGISVAQLLSAERHKLSTYKEEDSFSNEDNSIFETKSKKSKTKKTRKDLVSHKSDTGLAALINTADTMSDKNSKHKKVKSSLIEASILHKNDKVGARKKRHSSKRSATSSPERTKHPEQAEFTALSPDSFSRPRESVRTELRKSSEKPSESSGSRLRSFSLSSEKQTIGSPRKQLSEKPLMNMVPSSFPKSLTSFNTCSLQRSPEPWQQMICADREESDDENMEAIFKTPEYFRSDSMANAEDRRTRKSNRRSLLSLNKPSHRLAAAGRLHEDSSSVESSQEDEHTNRGHGEEPSGFLSPKYKSSPTKDVPASKGSSLKSAGELKELTSRLLSLIPEIVGTSCKIKEKVSDVNSESSATKVEIQEQHSSKLSQFAKPSSEYTLRQSLSETSKRSSKQRKKKSGQKTYK
ncbi:uncharacterized protein LOC134541556 [Bacillus rossius redtenbacheri]|uniref:uncharacterized protein LOC134541556 n=1 Tax=Bacillus rossius redtenbacheri TaxID=93214 RepID=UPI002FDDABEE